MLRVLEDALIKSATHDIVVRTRTAVALYILNQKRANLRDLERRFGVAVAIEADDTLTGANYHAIDRGEPATGPRRDIEPEALAQDDFATIVDEPAPIEEPIEDEVETSIEDESEEAEDRAPAHEGREGGATDESEGGRRRRRRRRRRGGDRPLGESVAPDAPQPADDGLAVVAEIGGDLAAPVEETESFEGRVSAGEGERGGRRSRRSRGGRNRFPPRVSEHGYGEGAPAHVGPAQAPDAAEADAFAQAGESEAALAGAPAPQQAWTQAWTNEPATPLSEPSAPPTQPNVEEALTEPVVRAVEDFPASRPTSAEGEGAPPEHAPPSAEEGPASASVMATGEAEAESGEAGSGREPAEPIDETPRPRRTGWWQRARASIVGN